MYPLPINTVAAPACPPCDDPGIPEVAGLGMNARGAIVAEEDDPALLSVDAHYSVSIFKLIAHYGASLLLGVLSSSSE
jgi:hypothetical protein